MRRLDPLLIDERNGGMKGLSPHAVRHRQSAFKSPPPPATRDENADAGPRGQSAQLREDAGLKARKQDPIQLLARLDRPQDNGLERWVAAGGPDLQLEIEFHLRRELVEDLFEDRDRLAPARVEPSDVAYHRFRDGASAADGLEFGVVRDDRGAIPGLVEIELQHVGALFDGERKRGDRVLRLLLGGPAVSDDEGLVPLD